MEKYTQMTLKMGSMSHNRCHMFATCHLCKSVQDYYKYGDSSNILGVKQKQSRPTITLKSKPVLRKPLTIKDDKVCSHANYMCALSIDVLAYVDKMSRNMTKPTKWHVRPAKTQISLGIRPV